MKASRFVFAFTAVFFLAGCVTSAGNRLRDVERARPSEVPRIEQTVGDYSFHLDGGKMITSNKAGRLLNDEILKRWKKWGYIASQTYVKSAEFTGAGDYEVTLGGFHDGDSSIFLQLISGFSLMVIPYYVNTSFTVKYDVRDPRTGRTWHAETADSYNTIISLILLPATPFAQGGQSKTLDRIAAELYRQLSEQGAFSRPVAAHAGPPPSQEPDPGLARGAAQTLAADQPIWNFSRR
jgi:hypothetical protein